ncbi:MAG: CCA tRNA nucleotidyltransferase [Hyphomicrobium sp.]|nr:CCA tRNA nucleotidyltransferase [Hyphomicrobium sp.]
MTSDPQHRPEPTLAAAPWLHDAATQTVLAAITSGGGEARIVGGAVRNTLLGLPVTDVDIATTVRPEDVIERAEKAGLSAIPTGIDHGTVTIIAGHKPFEVTTLRRDVETHGRHATVAFTEDWASDAHRRDFTINAFSCDAEGRLFDYTNGIADLAARRVRFIGRPEDRIAEDYLRILRFYRFTATYAAGQIDREGHEACAALQEGLDRISAERIRAELLKLILAPHAAIVLSEMDETGVLARILGHAADVLAFARLAAIEDQNGIPPDAMRRLYALAVLGPEDAARLRDLLRLSKREYERLADLGLPDRAFDPDQSEDAAKIFLYRKGATTFRDGVLVTWARNLDDGPENASRRERYELADLWLPPVLPVSGRDVVALGVPPGPEIGHIIETLDLWWMTAGFPADEALVRERLEALVNLKNR